MPALPVVPSTDLDFSRDLLIRSANASSSFEVVCAFPVSGQYGIGARLLYYALVVICIFARKTKWLRNGCLAAALLFPAVAAMHSIVLAAVHIKGAVDMDIYGAFQICTIGALAGPVTVRLSETYFSQPGRNAIFVWSSFVLAGLLSLTVEFYRVNPHMCDFEGPITTYKGFNYGVEKCGLICSTEEGPLSPIRGGSADNIDVIPTPHFLSFNAGMLVAAACCIPAILLLIGMWIKIHETKSVKKPVYEQTAGLPDHLRITTMIEDIDQQSQTSQPSNPESKEKTNKIMARLQNFLEIPVFGAAILAIVIVGEENLFSYTLRWDNEPMSNVGQWAPIAGIALALLGSLYILLAEAVARISAEEDLRTHPNTPAPSRRASLAHAGIKTEAAVMLSSSHNNIELIDKVAKWWIRVWKKIRIGGDDDVQDFQTEAQDIYPDVPGEVNRNFDLERVQTQWTRRSTAGSVRSGVSGHYAMEERAPEAGDIGLVRKATLEVPNTPTYAKPSLTLEPDEIEPCSPQEMREVASPSSPGRPRQSLPESSSSRAERPLSQQKRTRGPSIVIHDDG